MAMTIGQASALNLLLNYLIGAAYPQPGREQPITDDEAREAAAQLADAASKAIGAGHNATTVRARWAKAKLSAFVTLRHNVERIDARSPPAPRKPPKQRRML